VRENVIGLDSKEDESGEGEKDRELGSGFREVEGQSELIEELAVEMEGREGEIGGEIEIDVVGIERVAEVEGEKIEEKGNLIEGEIRVEAEK
jgi:hypothetical protein